MQSRILPACLVILSVVQVSFQTSAVRSALAIGYEAEDVAEDTSTYCQKIKVLAEEIRNETLDARDEVAFMDTVAAEESMFAYDYIAVKAGDMISQCNECITTMTESLQTNDSVVVQAENIGMLLQGVFVNKTQIQGLIDTMLNDVNLLHASVHLWGAEIAHLAENVIAAARDAQEEIQQGTGTGDEALDDAKDTKTEIKEFADEIIGLTEDMIHDAHESYAGDMYEDADVVLNSL